MRRYTKFSRKFKSKYKRIEWINAPDIKKRIINLLGAIEIESLKKDRIFCFRSTNANTRAYARIWGFSKIWQKALKLPPAYIVEVVSEKFDYLSDFEKDKVLLHEIAHIPRNFSGSLLPHIRRGNRRFEDKVRELVARYHSSRR